MISLVCAGLPAYTPCGVLFIHSRESLFARKPNYIGFVWKTRNRDVCRGSFRNFSQTDSNLRFFHRDVIPRIAKLSRVFTPRFLQSVLTIPVKALTGLAAAIRARKKSGFRRNHPDNSRNDRFYDSRGTVGFRLVSDCEQLSALSIIMLDIF